VSGEDYNFDALKGKVVLMTNVACACGLTNSNFKELVQLHAKHANKGLVVMCWPSNQFGSQERGSPEQIRE
jgi:glutathione peroxidase